MPLNIDAIGPRSAARTMRQRLLALTMVGMVCLTAFWASSRVAFTERMDADGVLNARGLSPENPRSFMNDTRSYFNSTSTVLPNATAFVTVTETASVQFTRTSASEDIETAELTLSGAVNALTPGSAHRTTVTQVLTILEYETRIVTATATAVEDDEASLIQANNSTVILTVTHTDHVTDEYISTVTLFVEPFPVPEPTASSSKVVAPELSSASAEEESFSSTIKLATTEFVSAPEASRSDVFDVVEESESGSERTTSTTTTTTTLTPTVFITQTVTKTPIDKLPLTTIESTLTTVRTAVVDATSTVVVTETVEAEPVCRPEHTHFFTVTETVTAAEVSSAGVVSETTTRVHTKIVAEADPTPSTETGFAAVTIYSSGDVTTQFITKTVTVSDTEKSFLAVTEAVVVTVTEETTVTLSEEPVAAPTEEAIVTVTEENVVTVTEEAIATITQDEMVPATKTIVQSSPLIGQEEEPGTSSAAELMTTEVIPVTHFLTETQTITQFVTYTTVATIDGAEVERPVTETAVHTQLITQVEVVTVTRTHRAGATEFVTATVTLASASAAGWPSLVTAGSALASLGNATWAAPRPSVSPFEVSAADTRKVDGGACMGLAVAMAALVCLL